MLVLAQRGAKNLAQAVAAGGHRPVQARHAVADTPRRTGVGIDRCDLVNVRRHARLLPTGGVAARLGRRLDAPIVAPPPTRSASNNPPAQPQRTDRYPAHSDPPATPLRRSRPRPVRRPRRCAPVPSATACPGSAPRVAAVRPPTDRPRGSRRQTRQRHGNVTRVSHNRGSHASPRGGRRKATATARSASPPSKRRLPARTSRLGDRRPTGPAAPTGGPNTAAHPPTGWRSSVRPSSGRPAAAAIRVTASSSVVAWLSGVGTATGRAGDGLSHPNAQAGGVPPPNAHPRRAGSATISP
jgi:hypothetical protein